MRKTLRPIAALAVTICLFGASVAAAPNDAEDVRSAAMGFSAAWNRHDMAAFGKLFAADADFVNVGGAWWKGRQEIQLHHAYSHGTIPENAAPGENPIHYGIFKHSTMTFVHTDVRFLRKDVAVAHVNWELRGDARTSQPRRGVLTFVLTRQNDGWLIAVAQNTEINRVVK
jgi:uncharacterized protein (TIGR02246 family)